MTTVWLVRAGEGSRLAREFESRNVVALGWPDVPGLADLRGVSEEEIRRLMAARGSTPAVAAADATELVTFRDTIEVGDIVVTPDAPVRQLLIGEVLGDYEYAKSPVGDYRHTRAVQWFGRVRRDALPRTLQHETWYRRTLHHLEEHGAEWIDVATRARDGAVVARPSVSPARVVRRSDAAAPTARDRVCPRCGYAWEASMFVADSEFCRDCR